MTDIRPILEDWDYEPGKLSVRKFVGKDGRPKVQMRLDLGLLQMELEGRPDGLQPYGYDSLLDYYLDRLEKWKKEHNTEIGFELSPEDCRMLREEATMYYHRYLACFVLGDYDRVLSDTDHNLRIFDLCNRFGAKKSDRLVLEQYRPYVVMMNVRAKASLLAQAGKYSLALRYIKAGLKELKRLYSDAEQLDIFPYSPEVIILKEFARQLRRKLPANSIRILKRRLLAAIEKGDFKSASRIKRQIKLLSEKKKRG